ncbi:MAG: hypothetical protein EZS28_000023 [Streblomastix strix]|uniref:NrS-1 polymerase-like helicase domain-containing protein n=1 Tax=Streblomastix strix TaxID=222440 RepID=A0A5J4XC03_9EUKA|nr:MAG: hypothetical protein EZS28_000023 [Streblomastix strix]
MLKDIADACIDGLKGLSIHNDTNALEREISLLSLFMGLNGLQHLGEQYKEAAYSTVQMNNNLTAKASEHWSERKGCYYSKANAWILTKIIKLHNKDYYESTLKPLIIKSYESKKQQKIETVVKSIEKNEIADGKQHITGIDALEQYHSLFEKLGIKFISDNQKIFSVFQGFKYTQLDEVNQTKIEQFLTLMKDTISANDERVHEYLLNLFAFIVQNVGKKTETAIILKGLQGIGKFNTAIENKMLAIANEMKNFGDSRMTNMDELKSIITEDSFVINEKSVPKHEVENIVNVMIVTNNIYPLKIENSDRRYVVCKCHPVHRGDLKDISQFNPRDIPMTQAKKDIIRASVSPVDEVIINHFKSFRDGVTCSIVEG